MVRLLSLCAGILAFCWSVEARAESPRLRVSVAPATVVTGHITPRVSLQGHLGLTIFGAAGKPAASPVGVFTSVGPRWAINRVFAVFGTYGYGWGRVPLEGSWDQEHRGTFGLYAGTPADGRLLGVSNRTRLDLRGVEAGSDWAFVVRARNETALILSF
ncbi:MAG: hypothetical protein ACPHRO_03760, partial [Nannocystaceae bacterium]